MDIISYSLAAEAKAQVEGVVDGSVSIDPSAITQDTNNRLVTDAQITSWDSKVTNVTTDISTTHTASAVTVNSSDGADGTINAATQSTAGVMSSTDKTKLDGIATSANNYTHPTYTYTTPVDDNETDLTTIDLISELTVSNGHVTGGTKRNLKAGANVSITPTADGDITISSTDTNTTYTAGDGMTASGTTFNVVSHAGTAGSIGTINVSADAIGVNLGTTSTTAAAGNHTHNYVAKVTSTDNAVVRFNGTTGEVQSSGVTIDDNGNITVSGTVDGRDIATDGTKLDGIEAGATADQTASEILTAIKTVDGTGSGLDADTLDGMQPATTNNASTIVQRDTSGNFSAGTITAALSGNASTATAFSGTRTVSLTGDVTGSTTTWTGSGALSIATTIAANSVALGTDTTGNYVAGNTAGTGISVTGTAGEGWSPTIALTSITAGSTTTGALKYSGTTNTAGCFYGGTTSPTGSSRLNYSGYFYPTYINLSATSDTSTAATHYFVETGSDGYVRPKTLANVQAEIVTSAAVAASGFTAGAVGGGSDAIFHLNGQSVTTSYSIPSGQNAVTAGDITINTGVTVTVPSGSRWVIV